MAQMQPPGLQPGYTAGNLRDLDARFKCTHCRLILRDAMQGDCGHRFCKSCVQAMFSDAQRRREESLCPACDAKDPVEISPTRTYPDAAMNREIKRQLRVLCPHSPLCDKLMSVLELEGHTANCEFKPRPCELCGQSLPAADFSVHVDKECPKRTVLCDVCKEPVVSESLAEHKSSTCIGSTVQCDYCLARVKDDEQAIDSHHRTECAVGWHEKNPCPYGCIEMKEGWQEHRLSCRSIHLDRLRAKSVLSKPENPSEHKSASSVVVGTSLRNVVPAVPASELQGAATSRIDYDLLNSLNERAQGVEQSLSGGRLPSSADAGDFNDHMRTVKYLQDMQESLSQGDKLNMLIGIVKDQLDQYIEKIHQCEQQMTRGMERKLDIERKHQEIIKLLAYKEMKILDLERRVDILEHAGFDGTLLWKIQGVRRRREEAAEGRVCSIYSPPFHTSKYGYKMCGRLYLNGDGGGRGTHVSLFFVVMRGAFDPLLPWPFAQKVTATLLDQNFDNHVVQAFKPNAASQSFKRPTAEMNTAYGFQLFAPLADFESGSRGFVKDDTMFVRFSVDKSDLPA